jgi:hypothetical protein
VVGVAEVSLIIFSLDTDAHCCFLGCLGDLIKALLERSVILLQCTVLALEISNKAKTLLQLGIHFVFVIFQLGVKVSLKGVFYPRTGIINVPDEGLDSIEGGGSCSDLVTMSLDSGEFGC